MDKRNRENKKARGRQTPNKTQLFEDTSFNQQSYGYAPTGYDYNNQQQHFYNSQEQGQQPQQQQQQQFYNNNTAQQPQQQYGSPPQIFSDPMANMAMQYGQSLAGQGSHLINQNLENYVSRSNIKYYFAVDTAYVAKKIALLLFPFLHKNWSMSHNQEEPVAPRFDINARDLYIPVMAFVTYILLAGLLLGMQERFSPEELGVKSSTALGWSVLEVVVLLLTRYIINLPTSPSSPSFLDWLAYSGYKYVGMIIILIASVVFQSTGYYVALVWASISISFFLIKSLRVSLLNPTEAGGGFDKGTKRSLYLIILVVCLQPLMMWGLTRNLAMSTPYSFGDLNALAFKPGGPERGGGIGGGMGGGTGDFGGGNKDMGNGGGFRGH